MTAPPSRIRTALLLSAAGLLAACAATPRAPDADSSAQVNRLVAETSATSVLGPDAQFAGSPYRDVGLTGLFPVRGPDDCHIAILDGGEDSFAARLQSLKGARRSNRIQALVFKGDETGVTALAFSPDGRRLASGGNDHTVRLWELAPALEPGRRRTVAILTAPTGTIKIRGAGRGSGLVFQPEHAVEVLAPIAVPDRRVGVHGVAGAQAEPRRVYAHADLDRRRTICRAASRRSGV